MVWFVRQWGRVKVYNSDFLCSCNICIGEVVLAQDCVWKRWGRRGVEGKIYYIIEEVYCREVLCCEGVLSTVDGPLFIVVFSRMVTLSSNVKWGLENYCRGLQYGFCNIMVKGFKYDFTAQKGFNFLFLTSLDSLRFLTRTNIFGIIGRNAINLHYQYTSIKTNFTLMKNLYNYSIFLNAQKLNLNYVISL